MIEQFLKSKLGPLYLSTLEQLVTKDFVLLLHRKEPGLWEVYNFQGRVNIEVHVDENFVDILLDDKHIGNLRFFKDLKPARNFVSEKMVEPEGLALLMQYQLQLDKHLDPNFETTLVDHIYNVCSIVELKVDKEQLLLRIKSAKKRYLIDHKVKELVNKFDVKKVKQNEQIKSGKMDSDVTVCTNGHSKHKNGD